MKPIKRYDISESVEVMATQLFELPYAAYDSNVEIVELQKALGRLKGRLQGMEDTNLLGVSKAVDMKGKLKYSNQTVREAEVRKLLNKDTEYIELRGQIEDCESAIGKMKAQAGTYAQLFKTIQNEVYYRRRIEELDNMRSMQKTKADMFKKEE
jgi:hypothetical protein